MNYQRLKKIGAMNRAAIGKWYTLAYVRKSDRSKYYDLLYLGKVIGWAATANFSDVRSIIFYFPLRGSGVCRLDS